MKDIIFLKKRLIYRSRYRGCKEIDLLLGSFAIERLYKFSPNELFEYEEVLDLDDHELYRYITCTANPPLNLSRMINAIISFTKEYYLRIYS